MGVSSESVTIRRESPSLGAVAFPVETGQLRGGHLGRIQLPALALRHVIVGQTVTVLDCDRSDSAATRGDREAASVAIDEGICRARRGVGGAREPPTRPSSLRRSRSQFREPCWFPTAGMRRCRCRRPRDLVGSPVRSALSRVGLAAQRQSVQRPVNALFLAVLSRSA